MDNQNLGRISMATANRPRKPFPLRADTYTSAGFGDCQPVMCRKCEPGTKSLLSHDVLVRLAPLLAPVRSRMGVRMLTKFVGMSELTENFPFLMADKPVSRGSKTFIPKKLPYAQLRFLSAMCLVGSSVSVYFSSNSSTDANDYSSWLLFKMASYQSDLSSWSAYQSNVFSALGNIGTTLTRTNVDDNDFFSNNKPDWASAWGVSPSRPMINIGRVLSFGFEFWIPVTQPEPDYMFKIGSSSPAVPLDGKGADFIIPMSITGPNMAGVSSSVMLSFAFKMSDFGARLRKILIGCGYQLDFYSDKERSIMPLMAYYKAYYDSFGLQLYQNWENTSAYKMLFAYESENLANWTDPLYIDDPANYDEAKWWIDWIHALGTTFYTEEQDFVSAHLRDLAVSSAVLGSTYSSTLIPNSPNGTLHATDNSPTDAFEPNGVNSTKGHGYISNSVPFSQLDLNILKKAYQAVNRNTIAGQRIAEILRANGLGAYVDECKSTFVGESYVPIDINDVNATADSFNSVTGQQSTLGDYVGKGVGYNESQNFTYENKEYGYLITIACVIPEAGYCQQEDPQVCSVSRDQFYLPDFDGMGFEANTKRIFCAQQDFGDYSTRGSLDSTFGFAPNMSKHKVGFNRMNGNFSRRSERDLPLTYTCDKFIEVGERDVVLASTSSTEYDTYDATKGLKANLLPCATPNLRFVGRLPWLGNFNRIFNLEGKISPLVFSSLNGNGDMDDAGIVHWQEYVYRNYDNFLLFVFNNYKQEAPMLQIEDSFETREDGNKGTTDISIGKA